MDRAFSSGASGTPPTAPGSPSTGYATSGNPGTATPATKPGAWWYHMVTEELRKLIVDAGLTPDFTNTSQVSQAVQAMIAAGAANDYKASVRAATIGSTITLAGGAPNTLDGVTLATNDRILVKDQTTGSQNGIYYVSTLGTGANGTWTRATDADQAGELTSGAIVAVEEGSTNADSQWMLTTDGTITIGTTSLTFVRKDASAIGGSIQGGFKNLQASSTGLSAGVSVTADEIAVENASNIYQTLRNVNLTIAGTSSGVANGLDTGALAINTWYSVWVIWNGTTAAGLLSLSTNAPTLPSGYTHKARVGWVRTDGTANKYPLAFKQIGRNIQYVVAAGSNMAALPIMASGVLGNISGPTWVAAATGAYAPPTAFAFDGVVAPASNGTAMVAPNNQYGVYSSTTNPPPVVISANGFCNAKFRMILETANLYLALGSGGFLAAAGWEDNI